MSNPKRFLKFKEKINRYFYIIESLKTKTVRTVANELNLSRQRIEQIRDGGIPIEKIFIPKIKKERRCVDYGFEVSAEDRIILASLRGTDRTRELVRIRDKRTCQCCGAIWKKEARRFDIHHLNGLCGKKSKSYDKISEIGGLITLCHKCHFNHPEHSSNLGTDK